MMRLAFRNLFHSRARLIISVGGVALALMLILALDAILTGVEARVSAYIDRSGADVFVSQKDVRNMHMAASSIPEAVIDEVARVAGVRSASPVLYVTNVVESGEEQGLVYVIGLPRDASVGVPWKVLEGQPLPSAGEVIVDRGVAEQLGVELGSEVKVLGRPFRVAGLSGETASLTNSIAFISMEDFRQALGTAGVVSFVLVNVRPGEDARRVAQRIETEVAGVTAQTAEEFARQERVVIRDMSTDLVTIMNLIGLLIGLAVMSLTVYTATLSRLAEFGVLKAVGARSVHLYRAVLAQALFSIVFGLVIGVGFTLLLSLAAPGLGSNLYLQVSGESLLKVSVAALVIAGISAVLPVRQIAGLDPAIVFRRAK
ncbi:MAG TPA: ABC transporter permease [Chloroflexia bacterium]|nr:ABC transporter permease [Chloroflexia bacterium]